MATNLRVLHVDDSAPLRDLTAECLETVDSDLTVLSEADPTAVLGIIDAEGIDCVVSDYEMPEVNGIELCRRVRKHHPGIPFFLFTNHRTEAIVDTAIASGVTDYIQKESGLVHYKILANRIRNAVQHYRAREQLNAAEDPA